MGNHQIGDMFLRINEDDVYTPYIGHTDGDDKSGYTLIHGHPLNGTKFFTWGQSGPGRFMQDFLAGGGKRQVAITAVVTAINHRYTNTHTISIPRAKSTRILTPKNQGRLHRAASGTRTHADADLPRAQEQPEGVD